MDFLDFEEETQIDESDSPHQSVSKLLDDRELLSEVRATPSIAFEQSLVNTLGKCTIEGRTRRRLEVFPSPSRRK